MKFERVLLIGLFVIAVVGTSEGPQMGTFPNQERGPSFSSPQETMHENGDRVSHYPPYYHPEASGGRR
jgi:hypothetical protein